MNHPFFLSCISMLFILIGMPGIVKESPASSPVESNSCSPGCAVMENDSIKVSVDTCDSSSKFGMITSIYDKNRGGTVGNDTLFCLRAGLLTAYGKKVVYCSADTVAVELCKFGAAGFTASMEYALSGKGVVLQLKIACSEQTDFPDGLNLDFKSNMTHLQCSNHLLNNFVCNVDTLPRSRSIIDFEQILQFSDSVNRLTIFLRNPFHSHFDFNNSVNNYHTLYILQRAPSSSEPGTPNAYSTIGKNDTIFRRIEVYANSAISEPVFFGEQPNGFSNSIAMFWDELPNRDSWTPFTSDTATDVEYCRFFLRLLKEDPAIKMGFLLLPDRLLYLPDTKFPKWDATSEYIISDTLEKNSGAASMMMVSDSERTLMAYQEIPCSPNTAYSLTYFIKTLNVVGSGAYGEVYGAPRWRWMAAGTNLSGNNSWQRVGCNFKTSPDDTALYVFVRLQDSQGCAFFDDIKLSSFAIDSNLLNNGGFDSASLGILFDNTRRHWTDAHGPEHIITQAPRSYLDFLQRIERHTLLYGWEDKVELGSHGYHHTPSLFEPDPKHEFYYYDPYGDSLRMNCIISETHQMGLTNASLRFMRSPGFEFTKSLLDILTDKGFVFFDAPYTGGFPFGSFMLQRGKNQLWMVRNAWWADNNSSAESTDRLVSVLQQGHLGVIGGHPEFIFFEQSESSYQRLRSIFSSLEASFPNLGYLFPDAYADNASSIYHIVIKGIERKKADIIVTFYGATDSGNTVVYHGICQNVLFNGNPINVKIYDGTTYAILPKTQMADDTLLFQNAVNNVIAAIPPIKKESPRLPINNRQSNTRGVLAAYTVRGQKICLPQDLLFQMAHGLPHPRLNLSSGVYIVTTRYLSQATQHKRMVISAKRR